MFWSLLDESGCAEFDPESAGYGERDEGPDEGAGTRRPGDDSRVARSGRISSVVNAADARTAWALYGGL